MTRDGRTRAAALIGQTDPAAMGQVGFLSISQPGTWIVALAGHFGGQKNKEYAKKYYVLCTKKKDTAKFQTKYARK